MDHQLAAKLEKTLRKIKKTDAHYPFWYLEMESGEPYVWVGRKKVPKNANVPRAMGKKVLEKHGIHAKGLRVTSGTLQFQGGQAVMHVLRRKHPAYKTQKLVNLAAKHDRIKSLKGARVVQGEWPEVDDLKAVAESAADAAQAVDAGPAAAPPAIELEALMRAVEEEAALAAAR